MRIFQKLAFPIVFISLIFVCYSLIINGMIEGQGGHDTFQYIEFSSLLFTENPYVYFYRPALYFFINILNSFIGWEPYSLTVLLALSNFFSGIIFYLITGFFSKNFVLRVAFSFMLIFSLYITKAVHHSNYVFALELVFILGFVYFLLKAHKKNNLFFVIMAGFMMFLGTHVHEDKFIFFFIFCFLYFFINKKKSIQIFSTFLILTFFAALYFGFFHVIENVIGVTGATADDWGGSRFSVISNLFVVLDYTLITLFNPIIAQFIYIIALIKIYNLKIKSLFELNLNRAILLSCTLYFVLMVIFFNQIKMPRVLGPVAVLYLFFVLNSFDYMLERSSKFVSGLIYIFLFFINLSSIYSTSLFLKRDVYPNKYTEVYNYILKDNNKTENTENLNKKILQLSSYENRTGMWGGLSDAYGLQSNVYFGDNARNINSLLYHKNSETEIISDLQKYDYIIYATKNKIKNQSEKFVDLEARILAKVNKKREKIITSKNKVVILKKTISKN